LWSVKAADGLAWGAWAYEKLPGRLMTNDDCLAHEATLGDDIAGFLRSLHAWPSELAVAFGVPSREAFWAMLRKVRSDIDDTLRERLSLHEYLRVQAWWDAFATDDALFAAPEALVHGDLWPDNMLVSEDGAHLLAVIDWGDSTVLDIAYDFAPLHHGGDQFAARCLHAYLEIGGDTDPTFAHRVTRYRELRSSSVFSLGAAVREDDEAELQDCLDKLRSSRILA
jgi:aminoglycoside phosphotransferase (APT) family kinase protein